MGKKIKVGCFTRPVHYGTVLLADELVRDLTYVAANNYGNSRVSPLR